MFSSEGVPLNNYDLKSENGGVTDIRSHVCNLLIGGGFAIVRVLVGLMCWCVQWIFNFPIVKNLVEAAQRLNSEFFFTMTTTLSLWGLFLAAGVAFGGLMMMRGKVARGAGEIVITLLLSSLVLMPALTPRSILGEQGPVVQTQLAAQEAGQIAANAAGTDPGCTSDEDRKDPSCPLRMVLTRTLVVQPYQLLQYGMIPDPDSKNANIKGIAEVHRAWIHGEFKGKEAGYCTGSISVPGADALCPATKGWDDMKEALKKKGPEGQAAYDFAVNSDWDRVAGVGLVLIAVLLIAIVVLGMALVHMGCQIANVVAASLTGATGVWAMLPGGNRAALWKWLGVFMTSVVTEFAVSVMLPIFALGTNTILTSDGSKNTFMLQRLLTLDCFALVLLVFHKRIFSAAGQIGDRFADRMRSTKIGGSLFLDGAPSGSLASGGSWSGRGLGGSLAALTDPALGRMNAAALANGAYGEVRKGLSALALPGYGLQAAKRLAVGKPLPADELARRQKPVGKVGPFGGTGRGWAASDGAGGGADAAAEGSGKEEKGQTVLTRSGRRMTMPANGVTPLGHVVHNQLLKTRAGRMALLAGKVGKFGWDATVGFPSTRARFNRVNKVLGDHAKVQRQYYGDVRSKWQEDWKEGKRTAAAEARQEVKDNYNSLRKAFTPETYKPLVDRVRKTDPAMAKSVLGRVSRRFTSPTGGTVPSDARLSTDSKDAPSGRWWHRAPEQHPQDPAGGDESGSGGPKP
ncbi:hypothetical protein ACFY00_25090 [Kitasatospora sp. NPDC001540]|uniref:hypothetical protein n=1 Tax=Kitasatospora sp. NPDC001540 TaxID=3364014 RepID=UPI0036969A93